MRVVQSDKPRLKKKIRLSFSLVTRFPDLDYLVRQDAISGEKGRDGSTHLVWHLRKKRT